MAERLARIHGTEEDRVNCPFYFKIGCCRHGDRCSRLHIKPTFSPTLLLPHMYQNPRSQIVQGGGGIDEKKINEDFLDFYEEVFEELATYGELEDMVVLDNLGDHMVGNMYVKFVTEEDAEKAQKGLSGRFYAGRPLVAEYCPVTDFSESRCRQYDEGTCRRGGYCNFMHLKHVPRNLKQDLIENQPHHGENKRVDSSPSPSPARSPPRERRRSRSPRRRDERRRSRSPRRRDDRRDERRRSRSPRRRDDRGYERRDDRRGYRDDRRADRGPPVDYRGPPAGPIGPMPPARM